MKIKEQMMMTKMMIELKKHQQIDLSQLSDGTTKAVVSIAPC